MTFRGLAILLVVSLVPAPLAHGQTNPADAGTSPPIQAGTGESSALAAPPPGGGPLVPSTVQSREAVASSPLREVPILTWVCGGLAAALLGVGLGFGISAANIDHRAGVNVSPMGVDVGLTRRTVLAGQTDATVANGLFIGAGVVALVGLAFAAFAPEPATRWPAPATGAPP